MSTHPVPLCPSCNQPVGTEPLKYNPHTYGCPEQTKEQLIKRLLDEVKHSRRFLDRIGEVRKDVQFWQAKFHTLRLENNGLRCRLRKQTAPAPVPEPQWHNPESVPEDELTDGRRFLTVSETELPGDTEIYFHGHGWFAARNELPRCDQLTYATRTPLPK